MKQQDAVSCRRFAWLASQRGYSYTTDRNLENVITVRETLPDFYVDTYEGVRFLAEVKSFEKRSALESPEAPSAMFVRDSPRRVNSGPVEKASQQLARYADEGIPLVIVLDNHRQVLVGLDDIDLVQIFGSLQFELVVDVASGQTNERGWAHNRKDHALGGNRRPWVSAVLVNIPTNRFDDDTLDDFSVERPMRVRIIHNPDATHSLPLWVFSGPNDVQIIRERDRWVVFRCSDVQCTHAHVQQRAHRLFQARGEVHGQDLDDWLAAERELRTEAELAGATGLVNP